MPVNERPAALEARVETSEPVKDPWKTHGEAESRRGDERMARGKWAQRLQDGLEEANSGAYSLSI